MASHAVVVVMLPVKQKYMWQRVEFLDAAEKRNVTQVMQEFLALLCAIAMRINCRHAVVHLSVRWCVKLVFLKTHQVD